MMQKKKKKKYSTYLWKDSQTGIKLFTAMEKGYLFINLGFQKYEYKEHQNGILTISKAENSMNED